VHVALLAPFRLAQRDPHPRFASLVSRWLVGYQELKRRLPQGASEAAALGASPPCLSTT
jgi:hypothetical protein